MTTWHASAPSNIAVIKYMGKIDVNSNAPANSSLSYTLPHLTTEVELTLTDRSQDHWHPLTRDKLYPISLGIEGQQRYLKHLQYIKNLFEFHGNFSVRSANNFPSDCGLASSASSFAALTRCAVTALKELTGNSSFNDTQIQAELSRHGSGSSCRSFFSPWGLWTRNEIKVLPLTWSNLKHHVIILEDSKKTVSSSKAHQLVTTSTLFKNRIERAENRLLEFVSAAQADDWHKAYEICWQEFWDMHSLFHTASPPFGYITANTMKALEIIAQHWRVNHDGPIVTLDAGANIHCLFRPEINSNNDQLIAELREAFNVL